jgi:hypothetical protein
MVKVQTLRAKSEGRGCVTERYDPARTAGSATPVLVIVDADHQASLVTEAALVRRFEPDYRKVTADSP